MNNSIRWEPVEDGEYDIGIVEYPLYIFGNTDPDVCTHVELYDEEVMLDLGMTICIAKPAPALEIPEEVWEMLDKALSYWRINCKEKIFGQENIDAERRRIDKVAAWLDAQRIEEATND